MKKPPGPCFYAKKFSSAILGTDRHLLDSQPCSKYLSSEDNGQKAAVRLVSDLISCAGWLARAQAGGPLSLFSPATGEMQEGELGMVPAANSSMSDERLDDSVDRFGCA